MTNTSGGAWTGRHTFSASTTGRWYGALFFLLIGWSTAGPAADGDAMKVAFMAPNPAGTSPHWDRTVRIMRAAADDLDIDLQVGYSKTNSYTHRKRGMALLTADEKPDYFVSGYWPGVQPLLDQAERLGVRTLIVGSGVMPSERDEVGTPRTKYRQWLGEMTPDDRRAGYELAERLIEKASPAADEKLHVIGLSGFGNSEVEMARHAGLEQSVNEHGRAVLDEFLFAEWSRTTASKSVAKILASDSPVSMIWSVSDGMALGAVDAIRQAGRKPGRDVLVGGFNWTPEGIRAVLDGEMEATLGGHFLQGAWALVLLYDYHHKHDFADDLGVRFQTPLHAITGDNAQDYLDALTDADWSAVDFKQLSKVHNPALKTYQWPLDQVMEQMRQDSDS